MADVNKLLPFILSWEGGFVNNPLDKGGATNKGVTISTWKAQGYDKDGDGDIDVDDLKIITDEDAAMILKKNYWDKWKADEIRSQSIANLVVDFAWGSGPLNSIKRVQRLLGLKVDGIVGSKTLGKLNEENSRKIFEQIWQYRKNFLETRSDFKYFGVGWMRRLNSIGYGYLVLNTYPSQTLTFNS